MRTAKAYRDMVGACARTWYSGSPYRVDRQRFIDLFAESGIGWVRQPVRDAYIDSSAGRYTRDTLFMLRDIGADFVFALDEPSIDPTGAARQAQLNWIGANFDPARVRLEWPNEADLFWGKNGGDVNWPDNLARSGKKILDLRNANAQLRNVPILGPSFGTVTPNRQEQSDRVKWEWVVDGYGEPNVAYTHNNSHCYAGESAPSGDHLNSEKARHTFGVSGMASTEFGWHTLQVTDKVQAIHTIRMWFTQFLKNWSWGGVFEFIDIDSNSTNANYHYGMLNSDFSHKQLFDSTKIVSNVMGARTAPSAPRDITYSATGDPAVRSFIVQRADNKFLIAIWREVSVWDGNAEVSVPQVPITVTAPAGTWQVFRPVGSPWVSSIASNGTATVQVGGDPVMVVV